MKRKVNRAFISFLIASMIVCLIPTAAFAATDAAADVKYTMNADATLDLDEKDFNKACNDLTGEDLNYIKFDLPDEDDGILYYNYDEDADEADLTKVSESKKYYYDQSSYISKITFVPNEDYSGTLTIDYKGYDDSGESFNGAIKIKVSEAGSSDTVTYKMDESDVYIRFSKSDFQDACKEIQEEDLDYVKFTLPDEDDGILYYDFDKNSDDNTEVTSTKKYYYDNAQSLSKVYFVPDKDFTGTVTIKYMGYDTAGDDYTGKVKITVDSDGESGSSSSDDTITYKISGNNDIVDFNKNDFNDVSNELNDEDIDYVKFTIPSATKGILYYEYSSGNYSSIVSSSIKYYYGSSPFLSKISFVPDDAFSGSCTIEFKGYDVKGNYFSGKVLITNGSSTTDTVATITYASKTNTATTFKDSDFNSVCTSLMSKQLSCVKFTLPSSSYGMLYYGYTPDGDYTSKVKESTKYYYDGPPYLLNVTFVPAKDITGAVTVSYTGYDTAGDSYFGKVLINISTDGTSTTPPGNTTTPGTGTLISSKYFKDVDISYSWAVPYIDSLYESGIISGSTVNGTKLYSPGAYVTRGDFIYLLYKALNFKTPSTATAFSDVPAGSYYYTAVNTAKALGIAQGSENKLKPNDQITREDAMVMILRAVNITGKTIQSGDTSCLTKYSDGNSISDYSRSAVAALIKAGIITGSDDNNIYPQGNLSRAQIAAIIYRVKNL